MGHAFASVRPRGQDTKPGATNVRIVSSPHWRSWLGEGSRCFVPFRSFSEYETCAYGNKVPVRFALDESRPIAAFAGIWTNWTSARKVKEGKSPPTSLLS